MSASRIGIGCLGVTTFLLGTRESAAAVDDSRTPGPHRIQASLGGEVATTFLDEDGHWDDSGGGLTLGLRDDASFISFGVSAGVVLSL